MDDRDRPFHFGILNYRPSLETTVHSLASKQYDPILQQLEALRTERMCYVARVAELLRFPEQHGEVQGYLRLIDNINEACILLARNTGRDTRQTATTTAIPSQLLAA